MDATAYKTLIEEAFLAVLANTATDEQHEIFGKQLSISINYRMGRRNLPDEVLQWAKAAGFVSPEGEWTELAHEVFRNAPTPRIIFAEG